MSTIVVGYDETPGSQRALERAATLAKALGSKLVVTSVTPLMVSIGRSGGPIDPTDRSEKHAKELEAARRVPGRAGNRGRLPARGRRARRRDRPACRPGGAEMIVVGTRELGLIQRLIGQSVSESVSHHAHCDVLIVHTPHNS